MMTNQTDDDLEILLKEAFEGPVPDNGFCMSVIDQLPARRSRTNWPMVTGVAGGVAMCWFSLASAPIANDGWRDWLSGELSTAALVILISTLTMAILAIAWTIAEADDRSTPSSQRIIR